MSNKKMYIEDRENMVWLPVLGMSEGVDVEPLIGDLRNIGPYLSPEVIERVEHYCQWYGLNYCVSETWV